MRWKAILEEFPRNQGILQAPEKDCQAMEGPGESHIPTLEVIDKSGDYRYDLTRFPHRGFLLTQGRQPPIEIEQLLPLNLLRSVNEKQLSVHFRIRHRRAPG